MPTCLEVEAWHLAQPSCLIANDEAAIPAKLNIHQTTRLVPAYTQTHTEKQTCQRCQAVLLSFFTRLPAAAIAHRNECTAEWHVSRFSTVAHPLTDDTTSHSS